ncbi:chromo domain-containing protein cec-1-like [Pseudorasbora parva]|uniref:chromo domain-containing protein cec-1-like n=1 Tax=Pseudorasbora parva TaxID=51549 RepID=UPI00351DF887
MDPENGEDKNLLERRPTDVTRGSSDATLPSHNRLPPQKESIADKKWEQDNGSDNSMEEQKLFKETTKLLEHNPKQTPQSVSETNQEDKEHGNEGELAKNEKNSESAVEAEEKTDEEEIHKQSQEEEEIHKQSQEEEEKESQVMKQGSGNGEKSPEHQNESGEEQKTGDDNEDNPTPGERIDRRDAGKTQIT